MRESGLSKLRNIILFSILILFVMIQPLCVVAVSPDKANDLVFERNNEDSVVVFDEDKKITSSFSDNEILVTISKENTQNGRVFAVADFPGINIKNVEELTTQIYLPSNDGEIHINPEKDLSLTVADSFRTIILITLESRDKKNVLNTIEVIKKFDFVENVSPNYYTSAESVPNDLFYVSKQSLIFTSMSILNAWDITTGIADIRVGIIDSGIANHLDLNSNVITGYDTVTGETYTSDDVSGHGTMVAGIIGAVTDNNIGIAGINQHISMVALQMDSNYSTLNIIRALEYARNNNISILNCSFGGYSNSSVGATELNLYAGLVVCSSGNRHVDTDASFHYPSGNSQENIISVSALNENCTGLADYSNWGNATVDLAAPGTAILSTIPTSLCSISCSADNHLGYGYHTNSGTSFSAPMVTAAAALIKSVRTDLNARQIKECILNTTTYMSSLYGKVLTSGRLNVGAAVEYALEYPENQIVSGDFNGDGKDDIARICSYRGGQGTNHFIEITVRDGVTGETTFWKKLNSYLGDRIIDRIVSGDFNGDGKDDIAAMYDYYPDDQPMKIHVFLSTGSSFSGIQIWYTNPSVGGYKATNATGRFISGDFNGDGKDDVAAMYDYGTSGTAKIHVFLSTGSSFNMWSAWYTNPSVSGYNVNNVAGRFVSGDFNGDGKDDVAAMYDYGSTAATKIHVFTSTGSSFNMWSAWYTNPSAGGYNVSNVQNRFVSGDFNGDGKDDVATMFDYGTTAAAKIHVFTSTGSSFNMWSAWYTNPSINGYRPNDCVLEFVSGDFNGDNKNDIVSMYSNVNFINYHYFGSSGSSFCYYIPWLVEDIIV